MSLQNDFVTALIQLAPEGTTARETKAWANQGALYFQDEDFQTILGVGYNFQDTYAGFNLTETTEDERQAIGAGSCASRPQDMTWFGWGYVEYAKGELKQVRDGIAYLLSTRTKATKPS